MRGAAAFAVASFLLSPLCCFPRGSGDLLGTWLKIPAFAGKTDIGKTDIGKTDIGKTDIGKTKRVGEAGGKNLKS